jgi:hypothetical protein
MLKMTRFTFDRVYPDGMKGVPNLAPLPSIRNHSQPRRPIAPTAALRRRDVLMMLSFRARFDIVSNNQFCTPARMNQLLQFDGFDDEDSVQEDTTGPPQVWKRSTLSAEQRKTFFTVTCRTQPTILRVWKRMVCICRK